ncbi:uncharacterized protein [Procambarus clarkii]|uniref:uncharacterized protein isoform X2 n=1 Tax=Procambarus clarkii TaxID=6728 RepID=UPI003744567E
MTVALERIDPQQWHPSESQVVKRNDKQKSQEETPTRKGPSPHTPRSSDKYELRNVTPGSYSFKKSKVFNTPGRTPARKILQTPFRTPRLRMLGRELAPDLEDAEKIYKEESRIWNKHLKLFLNKTHKLCHMSSVHNFRYKTDGLRTKYENTLKKKLQDESYARGVPSSQHSLSYNALKLLTVLASTAFSLNLPQPSTTLFAKVQEVYPSPLLTVKLSTTACFTLKPGAVDAVRIYITSLLPGLSEEQDKTVTVYSSWMIRTPRIQSTDIPGVEWFPIMLYTGRELIHHAVVEWLQGSFGCYITKYGMYQSTLMWVAGVWSGGQPCPIASHHSNKDQEVHFTYYIRPPSGMIQFSSPNSRGKPKLVLKNTLKDIQHIWQSIVGSSHDEMSIGELRQFFLCMNNIASELSSVPSSYLYLHQLYTPCIMLNGDGKVRLTCGRSASVLLNHLINIFIQTTNCYAIEDRLRVQDGSYINDDSDTGQETHEG